MRKRESEIIAENDNGDWIELFYDKKGNPDFYVIFFSDNAVTVTMMPEVFASIKELFWSITKDLDEGEE
jgi:hypothetical protein